MQQSMLNMKQYEAHRSLASLSAESHEAARVLAHLPRFVRCGSHQAANVLYPPKEALCTTKLDTLQVAVVEIHPEMQLDVAHSGLTQLKLKVHLQEQEAEFRFTCLSKEVWESNFRLYGKLPPGLEAWLLDGRDVLQHRWGT